jgi:hypothetical protein
MSKMIVMTMKAPDKMNAIVGDRKTRRTSSVGPIVDPMLC